MNNITVGFVHTNYDYQKKLNIIITSISVLVVIIVSTTFLLIP
jgi:hypothetical protein